MFVFVEGSGTLRDLPELTHSFPTRGASVLLAGRAPALSRLPAPGGRGARAAGRWQGAACGPTRRSRADLQSAGRRLNRRVGVEACPPAALGLEEPWVVAKPRRPSAAASPKERGNWKKGGRPFGGREKT